MVLGRLFGFSTPQREHGNERRAVSTGGVRKAKDKNRTPHRRPPNTDTPGTVSRIVGAARDLTTESGQYVAAGFRYILSLFSPRRGVNRQAVEGSGGRRARGRANGGAGGEEGGHSTHRHRYDSQENGFVAAHAQGDGDGEELEGGEAGEERMDVEGYNYDGEVEGADVTVVVRGRPYEESGAQGEDVSGAGAGTGGSTVENAIVIDSEEEGDRRQKYDPNSYRDGDDDYYGNEDYDGGEEEDHWGRDDGGEGYYDGEDGGLYADEWVDGSEGVERVSMEKGIGELGGWDGRERRVDYGVSITHKLELKSRQEAHAQEFQQQLKAEHDGKDFRRCLGPTTVQSRHGRPGPVHAAPLMHAPHQWPARIEASMLAPTVLDTDSAHRRQQQRPAATMQVAVVKTRREGVDDALGLEHIPTLQERRQKEVLDPVGRRQAEERMRMQHLRDVLEEVAREEKKRRDEAQRAPKALTEQQRQLVMDIWARGHPDQTMVSDFNLDITRAHLRLLKGSEWLNDEVINFYLEMVNKRSQADANLPKVHCFSTFFLPKLEESYDKVKRWTRRVDLFSKELVIVPVHRPMHWCLAVIDMTNKTIEYFDSLGGSYQPALDRLLRYLQQESVDKKKTELDTKGWVLNTRKDIPRQNNSSDCGMFMCKFAEHASRRAPFTFSQQYMPLYRERFVIEIVSKSIIVD